jgi:hypothetical protein
MFQKYSKILISGAIISIWFCNNFGIGITEDFLFPISFIFIIPFLFLGINERFIYIDKKRLFFYIVFLVFSSLSFLLGLRYQSIFSLILILVLYSLLLLKINNCGDLYYLSLNVLRTCIIIISFAGVIQFFLQFIYNPPWLFNYTILLPSWLHSLAGKGANTVIQIGSHFKSNGFFLGEPSGLSQLTALGILLEIHVFKQWKRLPILILALLLSFSGTGLLLLAFGLMFPLNASTIPRVLVTIVLALIIYTVLGKPLGLDDTVARKDEFSMGLGRDTSSGNARFIAPAYAIIDGLQNSRTPFFFGNGPGTMGRTITGYTFHDPTWAKLFFEYGFFGFIALITYLFVSCSQNFLPSALGAAVSFYYLFLGGLLLNTGVILFLVIFFSLFTRSSNLKKKELDGVI